MHVLRLGAVIVFVASAASCAIGPGTPLLEVVTSPTGQHSTVQPPKGYGSPISNAESEGLINPEDRKETEAYLKSLSNR